MPRFKKNINFRAHDHRDIVSLKKQSCKYSANPGTSEHKICGTDNWSNFESSQFVLTVFTFLIFEYVYLLSFSMNLMVGKNLLWRLHLKTVFVVVGRCRFSSSTTYSPSNGLSLLWLVQENITVMSFLLGSSNWKELIIFLLIQ